MAQRNEWNLMATIRKEQNLPAQEVLTRLNKIVTFLKG